MEGEGFLNYSNEDNLPYFVEKLRIVNADIVCLQESHNSPMRSLSREIAAQLGYGYVFETDNHPSHILPNSDYQLSTAILSKLPIEHADAAAVPYPSFELRFKDGRLVDERYDKFLQTAVIGGIHIANIHNQALPVFGRSFQDPDCKEFSDETEQFIIDRLHRPVIFCGDFNMEELETTWLKLMQTLNIRDSLPQITTTLEGEHYDYILYSTEFKLLDSGIVESESDHNLCWAIFEI